MQKKTNKGKVGLSSGDTGKEVRKLMGLNMSQDPKGFTQSFLLHDRVLEKGGWCIWSMRI